MLDWFRHSPFTRLFFFGNYFYGFCAVALSIEATLQQRYPLNPPMYYLLVFAATALYYTKAYIVTEIPERAGNERTLWYARNKQLMWRSQFLFLLIVLAYGCLFLVRRFDALRSVNTTEFLLISIFPLVSAMYYGIHYKGLAAYSLRNIGWLKPFIIGFSWTGVVTVFPILYYDLDQGIHYAPTWVGCFLFVKNFMFITVLCIMFDIKDYVMDYNQQLKTFAVNLGPRKTILYLIIPLTVTGLASFLCYAILQHFHILKILINTLPFLLVILTAHSLYHRRSIFYYLVIIDGLMLVKALCGITAMVYF